ncbi:MAG TPA: hypothetical protein VFF52_24105 [Isosphaeraceae bacterium]|nr:hypothetical protein [Isosphaeraceae bacterium]
MMIDVIGSWSFRPRLTMSTMMRLVAASAPCFALYAASFRFAPVRGSAHGTAALAAVVAWSLAAALPAVWVSAVRRTPPRGLLVRFAVGTSFLVTLMSAGGPLLFVILLGAAVLAPSLGWYTVSLMPPGLERDQIKGAGITLLSYLIQVALTFLLFIATIPLLDRLL